MMNMNIDDADFAEILQIQQNKPGRSPTRDTYRTRVEQAYEVLIEKACDQETIYYGELMDKIGTSRGYIGPVLGGVSRLELRQNNPPLSALAVRKETEMPGDGFWDQLLADHGLLEEGKSREQIWGDQVQRVYDHWNGR
jgi:hypothetical protein